VANRQNRKARDRRRHEVEHYEQPWQDAQRNLLGRANLCVDYHCKLSGGFWHAGPCVPCGCKHNHAIDECPEQLSRK
jgi:hypothetical protein